MDRNLQKTKREVEGFQEALLEWYDHSGREIPWRYKGGAWADPYRVWLSEIMCQQTTVQAVIPYFMKFTTLWPDISALAAAPVEEIMKHWAGLGYYARARNLHKCAKIVAEAHNGAFPETLAGLKALPGIGDYTAAAIGAMAFNISSAVVDGNVERVLSRIHAVREPFPRSKPRLKALAAEYFPEGFHRPGDLAQAFMDLGALICIPAAPRCVLCPVSRFCSAREQGIQNELPVREPKAEKPKKGGYLYLIRNGAGDVLLERRPETAMMGGMSAFPTSAWEPGWEGIAHPEFLELQAPGQQLSVHHGFTHFDLELRLHHARVREKASVPANLFWVPAGDLEDQGFPTLFKKAFKLWQQELIAKRPRKAV
jgi:A/G-specific adenine glycosylase